MPSENLWVLENAAIISYPALQVKGGMTKKLKFFQRTPNPHIYWSLQEKSFHEITYGLHVSTHLSPWGRLNTPLPHMALFPFTHKCLILKEHENTYWIDTPKRATVLPCGITIGQTEMDRPADKHQIHCARSRIIIGTS